jgi:hypothetical protein
MGNLVAAEIQSRMAVASKHCTVKKNPLARESVIN